MIDNRDTLLAEAIAVSKMEDTNIWERERERERERMSSQHGRPTKAEFLCVFPVLYRREKNAKKISVIEKKGIITLVKISLCVALASYSRLRKDGETGRWDLQSITNLNRSQEEEEEEEFHISDGNSSSFQGADFFVLVYWIEPALSALKHTHTNIL